MMANTLELTITTTITKTSQQISSPSQKHQTALLERGAKNSIARKNIRAKVLQLQNKRTF